RRRLAPSRGAVYDYHKIATIAHRARFHGKEQAAMIERYTRPEMRRLWSLENKFRRWLDVELAVCDAWAELGVIPKEAAAEIRAKAAFSVERILEIEAEVQHDVIAFTTCVAEHVGPAA